MPIINYPTPGQIEAGTVITFTNPRIGPGQFHGTTRQGLYATGHLFVDRPGHIENHWIKNGENGLFAPGIEVMSAIIEDEETTMSTTTEQRTTMNPTVTDLKEGQTITYRGRFDTDDKTGTLGKVDGYDGLVAKDEDGYVNRYITDNEGALTPSTTIISVTDPAPGDETTSDDDVIAAADKEIARLRLEVERQIAVAADERRNAQNWRNSAAADMDEFKAQIGKEAMKLAKEHDWCSVVTNALDEFGIPYPDPNRRRQFRITVEYVVEATADERVADDEIDDAIYIEGSITALPDLEMDSYWEDVECNATVIGVDSIETIDE